MTTTIDEDVRKRRDQVRPRTMASAMASAFARSAAYSDVLRWPCPKYQNDPVAFCREILDVDLWSKQITIIEAVRDSLKVAVSSGRRIGKSTLAACVALWFYASFPDARVILLGPTAQAMDGVLYREIRRLWLRARDRGTPLDGELGQLARTGLKAPDLREITGRTANEAEALQGIAGAHLCFLVDEATGVEDRFFEVIEGNRSGGDAKLLMISNPTRSSGYFFEAFHARKRFWTTFELSSLESPNITGEANIPGLATREEMAQRLEEYGEDSPFYQIHVLGRFVRNEEGRILSTDVIDEAERRWESAPAEGRLHLGVDVAGPGDKGDESCIAIRRGSKILEIHPFRPKSDGEHLAKILGHIAIHRSEREQIPIVAVDREGPVGSAVLGILRAHLERHPTAFELLPVRASDRAVRNPQVYDRVRDDLWGRLEHWIKKEKGSFPVNEKLRGELNLPLWVGDKWGRLKVTPKDEFRKALGRSCDRADAVALAVWEPSAYAQRFGHEYQQRPERPHQESSYQPSRSRFDPYANLMGGGSDDDGGRNEW